MTDDTEVEGTLQAVREWVLSTPEYVEKAPRRERVKRQVWQIVSSLAAALMIVGFYASGEFVGLPGGVPLGAITWFLVDQRVFSWGVERFDLVAPWQFREAEAENDE